MILTGEVIREPYTDLSVAEDPEQSKYVDVQVHPQGYVLKRVQLPRGSSIYLQPKLGTLILVFKQDDFSSKMITVLRDPKSELTNSPLRGESDGDFKPGEVQLESSGKAQLYLSNSGSAKLSDALSMQQFYADPGTQTAYVRGGNVCLTSNRNTVNAAYVTLDKDGNIIIRAVSDVGTIVERAIIQIAPGGDITVKSLIGNVDITSSTGNVSITTTGDTSINATGNVSITATGNLTIKGFVIKIGELTKKLVTSTFVSLFNSHIHTATTIGGPTTPPMAPMVDGVHTTIKTEAE